MALSFLKFGKSGGFDGLNKESIAYCHPVILIQLFNPICIHGFVPHEFGIGIVVLKIDLVIWAYLIITDRSL